VFHLYVDSFAGSIIARQPLRIPRQRNLLKEMVNGMAMCVSIEALQSNNGGCDRKIEMQRMNSGETKTAIIMST
jgi:hypothetical protein